MSNLYDDFEKRFTNAWFSAGWTEVELKKAEPVKKSSKDLETLQKELAELKQDFENICQKQLRLENLAKLYKQGSF